MTLVRTIELAAGLDAALWEPWCCGLGALVAGAAEPLHQGRNRLVSAEVGGQRVVVKAFRNAGLCKKLVYRLRTGKARRSFAHARRLQGLGLGTPAPLALVEEHVGGWLERSYYVCSLARGERSLRALLAAPDAAAAMAPLGGFVAALHEAGVCHRDLTQGNILIAGDGGGWGFELVDCNRMAFCAAPAPWRAAVFNLVQLEIPAPLQDSLLDAYAAARGLDPGRLQRALAARARPYRLKWAVKNVTRPWRRRLGL